MIREVDATPFTKRLHYSVEEVSFEEFMQVLTQQECKSDKNDFAFIRSKMEKAQR